MSHLQGETSETGQTLGMPRIRLDTRRPLYRGIQGDFDPLQLSGLAVWLRADLGITLATSAVTATGTAPPTVTLSGTPNDGYNIRIEITTAGVRGTAVFRWSSNGGTSYTSNVVTAATVALG